MIVNLNTWNFWAARKLIVFCMENHIDYEKAVELDVAWHARPDSLFVTEWTLDVPEEYIAWIKLQNFEHTRTAQQYE